MAIILAVGILVLPSLYAWFNIYANWDPYGSTGNMKFAIMNEDGGASIKGIDFSVGDEIVSNLKSNDLLDWDFVGKEEGLNGVKSGKYYAAVEIPQGFSNSLTSILSSKFNQPEIVYYANEKKNAIGTKITDKVVTTIQTEVNESFVTTVINMLNNLLGLAINETDITDGSFFDKLEKEVDNVKENVNELSNTVVGFSDVIRLSQKLNSTVSSEKLTNLLENTQEVINSTSQLVTLAEDSVSDINSLISEMINDSISAINSVAEEISEIDINSADTEKIKELGSKCLEISEKLSNISNILYSLNSSLPEPIESLNSLASDLKKNAEILATAGSKLNSFADTDYNLIIKETAGALNTVSSSIILIKTDFNSNIAPELKKSISALLMTLNDADDVISVLNDDASEADSFMDTLNSSLSSRNSVLISLKKMLDLTENQLNAICGKIENLKNNPDFNAFIKFATGNSNELGKFISCPVQIETDKVYGVENYGTAMAPFYSTLAFWVGGVILVAIVSTDVRKKCEFGLLKDNQIYFGRGLLFVFFGFIQGLIICIGDLYFLKIQCYHPVKFILAGCFASMVYSFFIYSLTIAFGDIGKAVAVIFLVVQIGGSGGTFPIDVTPQFFRVINPYLPFTFVIDAMRECICGEFGNTYWINLLKLCSYIVISLFIGLILKRAVKKPISFFNKRIKETDLF
ncbi:MAG: YhgE/Pip domain-containing protein [Clostridiales bacterium]|nr:YhgE/Pip domain-containing protein [Clostridiales bacterium]